MNFLSVWEKPELEKEQVRAVFTVGVLAILFGYQQIKGSFSGSSSSGAFFVDILTLILLMYWGIYVASTAISMVTWSPTRRFESILRGFKDLGHWSFLTGSITVTILAGIIGPFIVYEAYVNTPNAQPYILVLIIGTIASGIGKLIIRFMRKA